MSMMGTQGGLQVTQMELTRSTGGESISMMDEGGKGVGIKKGARSPSDCLIFHVHGGGFVAQTSKAHLNYLRDYASSIEVELLLDSYSRKN